MSHGRSQGPVEPLTVVGYRRRRLRITTMRRGTDRAIAGVAIALLLLIFKATYNGVF